MRTRSPRATGLLSIGVVLVAAGTFSLGCTKVEKIGGRWEVETRTAPMPESGNVTRVLYRRSEGGNRQMVGQLGYVRYYDDDCVVFEKGGLHHYQFFVACGDRRPVLIVAEDHNDWSFEPTEIVRLDDDPISFAKVPGRRISIGDLKRQAMGSPE